MKQDGIIDQLAVRLQRIASEIEEIRLALQAMQPTVAQPMEAPVPSAPSYFQMEEVQPVIFAYRDTAAPSTKEDVEEVDVVDSPSSFMETMSVIDMYRYRHELFGDDDEEMRRVLAESERITSQEELHAYFYDLLQWDERSVPAADFLSQLAIYLRLS